MNLAFFDFTVVTGGGTQGTLYLLKRLQNEKENKVFIVDAYGVSQEYLENIATAELPVFILSPNQKKYIIGFVDNPYKRLVSSIKQIPSFLKILAALYITLKKNKPDIVMVNNEKSLLFVGLLKKILNYKVVLYYRGEGNKNQISQRFVKINNTFSDLVIAHSKIACKNLSKNGFNENKINYVHNCIELKKFDKPIITNDLPPKKAKTRLILLGGRITKEKGYHTALEALKILIDKGYDVDIILPGLVNVLENKSYIDQLNEYIIKNNLNRDGRIHFIGWRENFIGDLVQADIALLPSFTEGFPRAIIESMVQGIPVCATPVGGVPEVIKHLQTGMLFNIENSEKLAENIEQLISDDKLYSLISAHAKDFARSYFHPSHNTNGVNILLKELL